MRPRGTVATLLLTAFLLTLAAGSSKATTGGKELKHKYYLLAETGHKPMCSVDVHINNEHILRVGPNVKKEVLEVTQSMKAGENSVSFEAQVIPGEGDDYSTVNIQIGEGEFVEDRLVWEAVKVSYTVSRASIKKEKKDVLVQTFTFQAE